MYKILMKMIIAGMILIAIYLLMGGKNWTMMFMCGTSLLVAFSTIRQIIQKREIAEKEDKAWRKELRESSLSVSDSDDQVVDPGKTPTEEKKSSQ